MATRRPTEPPRSPDLSKEIPNVIKADEKLAPKAPRARAKSTTPRAKKPAAAAAKAPTAVAVSEDVRRGMIAEGAYLRAERRGFAPGHEAQDWLEPRLKSTHCSRHAPQHVTVSSIERRPRQRQLAALSRCRCELRRRCRAFASGASAGAGLRRASVGGAGRWNTAPFRPA